MKKRKLLSRSVFLSLFSILFTGNIRAQIVGADAFIKGTSVEIGIAGPGGFEGAPWNTASPPLPGMHYRSGNAFLGFVSNPQVNAWATYDGDFFTPGSPENGWGVTIGNAGPSFGNNCSYLNEINGSITNWSHIFNCYSADWEGNLSSSGTDLHFKINYFLQQNDLFYTTTISITNNGGATVPDLYYYRNLDPDNNQSISGDFTTQNTIVAQPYSGLCNTAHVKATSSLPASQPVSYIGLAGVGANWRACYGGFSNRDASALWNGTGFTQTVGSTNFMDEAIALAYRVQNLAPGATETFKFVVILDDLAASNAINNSVYLSYPGSLTAAPAVCTPYNDTVKICSGAPATISVAGPTISSYNWSWSPGTGLSSTTGPSVSANPAATTTYTVSGTPINACFTPITMSFVVKVSPGVTVAVPPNASYCPGNTVPATSFTSTPAGATFTWTNSNTAIGLTGSGSGNVPSFTATNATGSPITATITVTPTGAAGGCTGTPNTYTITVNPPPTITVNNPTICPSQTATLTAAGGTTYSWSNGATGNPITVSPAVTTSYTVTGTTGGCSGTAVSTVTIGGSMSVTVNSPTICAGQTANLVAGGATTYSWTAGATSTGANTANAAPMATTSYTVTGTSGGCTGTAISTVTVTPLPTVTVSSPAICNGSTATMTASGATGYTWSAGATSTGVSTADATPSTTTSYTVTGTQTGCSNTAVSTVTVNPIPVVTVNSPAVCPGITANLIAGGATTYIWSAGATSTGPNTADATPAVSTTYTVTGTSLGCSATAISSVTVNSSLTVNAGPNDSICFGGNTGLTASPNGAGFTYSWSPATGLSNATIYNPIASPATTTTYTVTVTSAAGCTGTSTVTIYADPQITLSLAGLAPNCNGGTDGQTIVIPAGGSGSYGYNWTPGGCNTAACNVGAGTYTVTVTDTWGCTATGTSTVTEPTAVTATSTQVNVTCFGTCNGTATATGAGGTPTASGGYNYSWNTVPVQNTQTATGLCSGTYTCTVTDANGCSTTVVVTITEPTVLAVAPIPNVIICNSGSTTITATVTGGTGAYTYSWSPATGLSSAAVANPTAAPAGTTGYTVTATDANGCTATASVTVTVNPPLSVITAGTASVCPGFSTTISAIASNGAGSGYTYSWSPAAGLSDPAIDMPTATPAATTTYTVTANDGCSPAVTATVTVTVLPKPVPVIASNVTSGCEPLCVNFTDASTISSGSVAGWNWNFGDGGPDSVSQNPSHCFMAAGSYTITLTDTSAAGCITTSTIPYVITVNPIPVPEFTAPASTSIFTPTVQYIDQSSVIFGSIAGWNWKFGDYLASSGNDSSDLQNPSHLFSEVGSYCAMLTVTSNAGCIDSVTHCIIIDPEFTFFIPNAFSPNADGVNDEFYGKGDFIKTYEMSIYDRWGNLIFHTDDINTHWDGKANHGSEAAQEDVYVYVVKLSDYKDKKHKYIGSVTIVK
ncbi:MAG: hypothetical protein JWO44_377 [Bacteroidetes bacterium]|nr:hypothetical protein [Bacteroidota bacterium]